MNKGVIAGVIAVVALLAIGGVLLMNNKDNKKSSTSSTSTTQEDTTADLTPPATDTPAPAPGTPSPTPTPPAAATAKVSIDNFAFNSKEITVKKGTTVTWTNNDSTSHTVTGDSGGPSSDLLGNGESYSFTFTAAGTFSYHCEPHPSMRGRVVVQ